MKLLEIKDIKTYKASEQKDIVLRDDLRILSAWYTTLKTKGEFKYPESEILRLAKDVIKEMVKREQEFHPENWKNKSIELFVRVFKDLKNEIKIPENVDVYISGLKEDLKYNPDDWRPEFLSKLDDFQLVEKLHLIKELFKDRGSNPQDEEIVNAYILLTEEIKKRKIEYTEVQELEALVKKLQEGIRPAFGSPGGKRFLAKTICSYIPEHKTYVEPFAGGAAVFFSKKPSEIEVLNDKDSELISAFKFMKDCTEAEIGNLKKMDWSRNKEKLFDSLKQLSPRNRVEQFHKFVITRSESYGGQGKKFAPDYRTNRLEVASRIPRLKDRLKNTRIYNQDYQRIVKESDSKEVFFYLDPPYPNSDKQFEHKIKSSELAECLKNIKGKFILSINSSEEHKKLFSNFNIKEIEHGNQMSSGGDASVSDSIRKEFLVSNFPLEKSNTYLAESFLDSYVLDIKKQVDDVGNILLVPNYVSLTGSTLYAKDRLPNDLDIVIRDDKFSSDYSLKLNRLIKKLTGQNTCLHLTPQGPNWRHFPLFNLALVPVKGNEFIEVGKEEPGFADSLYEQGATSSELIEIPEDILKELILEQEFPPLNFKEDIQEAKKPPDKYPKDFAVLVNHFRGKSAHLDFRRKQNGFLQGETILNQPEGLIGEEVDTIAKGKKWTSVLLKKGKFRPDMNPKEKAVLVGKTKHPLVWLNIREVSYPPGSVGATKYEGGTFVTMDSGLAHPGVQRTYFKEFFLDMNHFKGRMVQRLLGVSPEWEKKPKGPSQWQTWTNMEDQTPYILSKRQRKDKRDYIPKEEEKAIPPEWEKEIKPDFQWWKKGVAPKERMKRLDLAYNDLIEKEMIKARPIEMKESILQEKKARFNLRFLWWMGPKVVRGLPATDSRFQLLLDSGKSTLDRWDLSGESYGDPTKQNEVTAIRKKMNIQTPNGKPFREWMSWAGAISAKNSKLKDVKVIKKLEGDKYLVRDKQGNEIETKETFAEFGVGDNAFLDQWENLYTGEKGGVPYGNPNERIPVYIEIEDTGDVEWIEETDLFSSFNFKGNKLKGFWTMQREDPKSDLWVFKKGKIPGQVLKEELYFFTEGNPGCASYDSLNVSMSDFPIEIKFESKTYDLIKTKSGKLLLNKKEL